jgi:hypothetical protein
MTEADSLANAAERLAVGIEKLKAGNAIDIVLRLSKGNANGGNRQGRPQWNDQPLEYRRRAPVRIY